MLRIFILFSLLLALIPMAHLSAAELENANVSGPETAPVLTEHEPFSAQVIVRNPHDRAVRIEHLDASCACMHLEAAENFILPHQTTVMRITVDNANRSGPQRMGVSIYLTDPELESIEVVVWWSVNPDVTVDAISPLASPAARPTEIAWRDVYKFAAQERPDELNRLAKRVRVASSFADFTILGVDYAGPVWRFTPTHQADGSWLITAAAKDPAVELPEKVYDEIVTVRTNHPRKANIPLQFLVKITRVAGSATFDPFAGGPPAPPGMPAPDVPAADTPQPHTP